MSVCCQSPAGGLGPIGEKVEAKAKDEEWMVTIKLFGMMKSLAGNQGSLSLALVNGRRVKDLVELLDAGYPMIGELSMFSDNECLYNLITFDSTFT